jgi:hypothetical protein
MARKTKNKADYAKANNNHLMYTGWCHWDEVTGE